MAGDLIIIMFMVVLAHGDLVVTRVPMYGGNRRPSELERNDEHEDQGEHEAHLQYSTWTTKEFGTLRVSLRPRGHAGYCPPSRLP